MDHHYSWLEVLMNLLPTFHQNAFEGSRKDEHKSILEIQV